MRIKKMSVKVRLGENRGYKRNWMSPAASQTWTMAVASMGVLSQWGNHRSWTNSDLFSLIFLMNKVRGLHNEVCVYPRTLSALLV